MRVKVKKVFVSDSDFVKTLEKEAATLEELRKEVDQELESITPGRGREIIQEVEILLLP